MYSVYHNSVITNAKEIPTNYWVFPSTLGVTG